MCTDRWWPTFAPMLDIGDTDHDGRAEILAPRAFAARICIQSTGFISGVNETYDIYTCPQQPIPGAGGTGERSAVSIDLGGIQSPDRLHLDMYNGSTGGFLDPSAYFMDSVRFVQNASGGIDAAVVNTPIIQSGMAHREYANSSTLDVYGTGMNDAIAPIGLAAPPPPPLGFYTSVPLIDTVNPQWGPATLPDGTSVDGFGGMQWGYFLSEDIGTGYNPDGKTPEQADLMSMVTDGFGAQTVWTYYPLSSAAGRTTGQTPLYTIPSNPTQRYIDSANIYFTSSMPVVSDMAVSDGIGGFHTLRYGYSQAMYNTQGRGFQGFRTIIEEDLTAGLRTTTLFNQKFPLVSKVQEVFVNALASVGTSAPLRHELYTWRCNLANRNDATACTPPNGTATVKFPYLDKKEAWTFDATVALAGGTPAQIGYSQDVNAFDSSCAGTGFTTASGFDKYGNLTGHTVLSSDSGTGTGGVRAFVTMQCNRTVASYASDAATLGAWWLDKLNSTTTTSAITYNATNHALPSGTSNSTQTLTTTYLWNTNNRTLQQETVQPGVTKALGFTDQQRITSYVYPSTSNYGLPTAVAVAASGDPNGTRSSGIAYSGDGYFPYVMSNALGQSSSVVTGARDGQPTLTVDVNGLRTLMNYDPFGQLVHTQFHGASDSVLRMPDRWTALDWCASGCNAYQNHQMTIVQDGTPVQIAIFDILGRTTATIEREQDGVFSWVYTYYNPLGRLSFKTEPFRTGDPSYATTFQYDPLGRMTQKIVPKGAEDGRGDLKTTYTYSGLQTAIRVCGTKDVDTSKCLNMTRTTDSMGRYMETVDASTPGGVTQYWTDANGHTLALKDANGSITTAAYNAIGQRSSVSDPNQGTWSFGYNALGETLTQTDARGIVTSSAYDKLGRPLSRTAIVDVTGDGVADKVVDSWTYDPLNGIGELATSQRMVYPSQGVTGAIERSQTHTYDTLARLFQTNTSQQIATGSHKAYTETMAYDSYYGWPKSIGYPNGEAVATLYSKYGQPIESFNPATGGEVYRHVTAVDARGNPTIAQLDNGVLTDTRTHRTTNGELTDIVYTQGSAGVRRLDYHTDVFGNLTQQFLNISGTAETYTYDPLQRMTSATRSGGVNASVSYQYDATGNFTYKTDFSTTGNAYVYTGGSCGGGPNAVKSVAMSTVSGGGTRTYCYDANGNLVNDSAGLAVKYDHDNLAYVTTRGPSTINLAYGPDNQRTREWGSDGTKVFVDGYEDWISAGSTKVYVGTEAEITKAGATRTVNYLLTDRLGSVDSIADGRGNLIETRGSDAFGKPRSGTWADLSPARIQSMAITGHGFTGHEHLNSVELIHMNGRVYDYQLGRFFSVDPIIAQPLNSQSLNPYSYIGNNPLSGTDPTGYEACTTDNPCVQDPAASTGSHIAGAMTAESLAATGGSMTILANDGASGGKNNGAQKQNTTAQTMPSAAPATMKNSATQSSANDPTDSFCVTASGASACGSGSAAKQTFEEKRKAELAHVYGSEVLSTPAMDAAVVANKGKLAGLGENEGAFYVTSGGTVVSATVDDPTSSCATVRVPSEAKGAAHDHLVAQGDLASTEARELPGPLDTDSLTLQVPRVQYIITPTNAVRKIEAAKASNGTIQPRLTTLDRGGTYTRDRDVKRIDAWSRSWDDMQNFKTIDGLHQ